MLPDDEIAHVKERFKSYGPRPKVAAANENRGEAPKNKKKKA